MVAELVRVVRPGGLIHFLCEDYGSVIAHPCALDVQAFWRDGPCTMFKLQDSNPHMGRCIFTEATRACKAAGVGSSTVITVKQLSVDTCSVERELLAQMFRTWKDYSSMIAEHSKFTLKEVEAHWEDIIACCKNDEGYVSWQCTVCSVMLS